MKKYVILLVWSFLCYFLKAQDCQDLFISEIVFGQQILPIQGGNSAENVAYNYAIEVFNPTSSEIDLSGYSIDLVKPNNDGVTTIQLSGQIPSKRVQVIANEESDAGIQALADVLSERLKFEGHVALRLKKGNTILDEIGDPNLATSGDPIDLVALLNDPTVVNDWKIDLGSIRNLTARIINTVTSGQPVFNEQAVLYEWLIFPSGIIAGLGEHTCACNASVVCFQTTLGTITETAMPTAYNTNVTCTGCTGNTVVVSSYADGGSSLCVGFAPATPNSDFNNHGSQPFNFPTDVTFTSDGSKSLKLFNVINDALVEPLECASFSLKITQGTGEICFGFLSQHSVRISSEDMVSTKENPIQSKIKVFPTTTNGAVYFDAEESIIVEKCQLFDASGVLELTNVNPNPAIGLDLRGLKSGYKRLILYSNRGIAQKFVIKL